MGEGGLEAPLQGVEDALACLGRDVFIDICHARQLVAQASGSCGIGDTVVTEPGPVGVPPIVEGESGQRRRVKLLRRNRAPRAPVNTRW